MFFFLELRLGEKVIEGKTKVVYQLPDQPGQVLVRSKDRITAGDGARAHDMAGKAAISTVTGARIYELLNDAGESDRLYDEAQCLSGLGLAACSGIVCCPLC